MKLHPSSAKAIFVVPGLSLLRRFLVASTVLAILCTPAASLSIGLPSLPKPPTLPKLPTLPVPDVSALLGSEPITTSLADAVTGIPFLNDYEPGLATNLTSLPHDSEGRFHLVSGSYWYDGRSYCLHAGTHAPSSGSSYLYAPLKGPKAPIIEDILRNSASHLEIPQSSVQQLIWAILARARFSDLSPGLQAAAAKLLSPAEILELNTSAIGFVPADKLNALLARVPDPMKPLIDAENSLRGMLTSNATYQDVERVAVLPALPQTGGQAQAQAEVRWSYDPHGFFMWFTPHGYPWTTAYVDVPGAITDTRDRLGRIVGLRDKNGDSVSVKYSPAGLNVAGDSQTLFYRLESVRFVWQDIGGHAKPHQETWPTHALVMVGTPNGRGSIAATNITVGAQSQYDNAAKLRNQFTGLLHQIHGQSGALPELMALAELRNVLTSVATARSSQTRATVLATTFPAGAWESVLARSPGGRVAADVRAGVDQGFDPSNDTGVPQNSGAQRLAQSPNPYTPPPGPGDPWQQQLQQGFQNAGWPAPNANNIPDNYRTGCPNCPALNWQYGQNSGGQQTDPNDHPERLINGLSMALHGNNGRTVNWLTTISYSYQGQVVSGASGYGDSPASSLTNALQQLRGPGLCCPAP